MYYESSLDVPCSHLHAATRLDFSLSFVAKAGASSKVCGTRLFRSSNVGHEPVSSLGASLGHQSPLASCLWKGPWDQHSWEILNKANALQPSRKPSNRPSSEPSSIVGWLPVRSSP